MLVCVKGENLWTFYDQRCNFVRIEKTLEYLISLEVFFDGLDDLNGGDNCRVMCLKIGLTCRKCCSGLQK